MLVKVIFVFSIIRDTVIFLKVGVPTFLRHFSDLSTGDVMSLLGESENPGEKLRGSASRSKILFYENVMIFVLIVY